MSSPQFATDDPGQLSREEMLSALFAQLVMQQANLAMMLLGKTPNPETGTTVKDLETARLFIDQLEMMQVKTKGNLTQEEEGLIKQCLMSLRLAYVEAVEEPQRSSQEPAKTHLSTPNESQAEPTTSASAPSSAPDDSRKKFSKKY